MLSDQAEILTQAAAGVPQGGEPWDIGQTAGFILTLPAEAYRGGADPAGPWPLR